MTSSRNGPGGRKVPSRKTGIAILAVWAAIGVFLAYYGGRQLGHTVASRGWPTATAKIVRAQYEYSPGSYQQTEPRHFARIHYTYSVGDRQYSGDRIAFGYAGHSTEAEARTVLANYPDGAEVLVRYDPSDPTVAVLSSELRWLSVLLATAGVLVVVLASAGIWVMVRRRV